jgi:hypothetical protein
MAACKEGLMDECENIGKLCGGPGSTLDLPQGKENSEVVSEFSPSVR